MAGKILPTLALGYLYKREQISGSNKTCFCECLTGEAAITVNAVRSCPSKITR